ncbi:hypothetical protein [Cognaticolwellia beringensis]|uniref:Lipoprotein n=1 Tax=Cognaticolwellia beringensis TaxID=1967665 RepID=A0A222GD66_9GAMM|nr:hypothetical protein [Cognaticolwellia beringensis]ASP49731.1 hypothetical protein B5D82_19325 [Cognaticolwellia beringensis]
MNSIHLKRKRSSNAINTLTITLVALILQGCGGSGTDSENSLPTESFTPVVTQTGIIAFDEDSKIAQPIELFLYYPNDTLNNISWQQTAGNNLVFHAGNAKGIAFTPSMAGDYSFQVNFIRNGQVETLSHTFTVSNDNSQIAARLGHAVLEGNDVSLRASIENSALKNDSIIWQQLSGPRVTFSETTAGENVVYFKAPAVSIDSLLTFSVSASDGATQHQDTIAILVENAPTISTDENIAYDTRLATVFPFNANSPYADVLVNCVYSNDIDFRTSCRLSELPLIAQDTTTPTIEDIMDRVVVSHQWMGQRFKEFLQNWDQQGDFKNLLRATTAIVISYDVRPSYYWVVTGAIHLDPNNLWLTPDERDTINEAPDYRASFGDSLNFVMPWRYVKNNDYASFYYPENMRVTREASDGIYNLASLMYHELAHANDFFAQSTWANLNRNDRILDAADKIIQTTGIQSDLLSTTLTLNGAEMYRLAQVRYKGETATSSEKNYSPSDVTSFFSPEHAPQFYNYSSKREDYAMLFDGFMMKARYDIDRDIAITNQPQSASEQYIVTWGQRGRIGDENIKQRVDYVTRRILPEFTSASGIISNLSVPIMMESGKTWTENLTISPTVNNPEKIALDGQLLNNSKGHRINADGPMFYEKTMPTRKNN